MGAHHSRLAAPKAPRATLARGAARRLRQLGGAAATAPPPLVAGRAQTGGGAPHPVARDVGDDEGHGGGREVEARVEGPQDGGHL
eukprot:1361910-Prymnesium_polylepis.1